jgi:hypothetical protein
MRVLRVGCVGDDVLVWEEFLRGLGFYWLEVDGNFDQATKDATKDFQRENNLGDDGEVGGETLGKALMLGFKILDDNNLDKSGANWPPKPNFSSLNYADREKMFGHIEYKSANAVSDPEAIIITNDWTKNNIVRVEIPQLSKIPGIYQNNQLVGKTSSVISVHKLVVDPMIKLWKAWEKEGLLDLVITWSGMWVPRFVRGSRSVLSNHAYGTAFDINAPWNGLRMTPALVGKKGSVRELVSIAADNGFYWGGWWDRLDGMHFELAVLNQ